MKTPCKRRCWSCGNVADHADNITPDVCCKLCGSQDTRLVKEPKPDVSEQVKTPGQVCFEKWIEREIRPLVTTPLGWEHADPIKRYNWEQIAIAAHKAVEEQRRNLNDATLSQAEQDAFGARAVICECCFSVVPAMDVIKGNCRACRGCCDR